MGFDSAIVSVLKDVRANGFCASLLRTQMHMPRHTRARALSNKMNNDRADVALPGFNGLGLSVTPVFCFQRITFFNHYLCFA